MNHDIVVLREVVSKLTPLLAGKGLQVTQRGTQARVEYDTRTGSPCASTFRSFRTTPLTS